MKITICGSSTFRQQMIDYKEELEKIGHEAIVHHHYVQCVKEGRRDLLDRMEKGEHAEVKKENDYIRWYHNAIKDSDAVLILNFDKNGIKNYIGGNTLIEIGFAHINNKKVFLLNDIPKEGVSYIDEIKAMVDVSLNGDLTKIN